MNELESLVINQGFNKLAGAQAWGESLKALGGRMRSMVQGTSQAGRGAAQKSSRGAEYARLRSANPELAAADALAQARGTVAGGGLGYRAADYGAGIAGGARKLRELAVADPRAALALAGTGGLGLYGTYLAGKPLHSLHRERR